MLLAVTINAFVFTRTALIFGRFFVFSIVRSDLGAI